MKGMIVIAKVSSDRKLELIRLIRLQNQSNRNECMEKERFLYGYAQPSGNRGELYSAEMATIMEGGADKGQAMPKEAFILTGFRIRFLLAAMIMVLFIYMDKSGDMLFGKTMEELALYFTESISVEETLNSFDL